MSYDVPIPEVYKSNGNVLESFRQNPESSVTSINFEGIGSRYQFFTSEGPRLVITDMSQIDTAGSNVYWKPTKATNPLNKNKPLNSSVFMADKKQWANVTSGAIAEGGQNYMAGTYVPSYTNDQKVSMPINYGLNDYFVVSSHSAHSYHSCTTFIKGLLTNNGYNHDISWDIVPTFVSTKKLQTPASQDYKTTTQSLFPLTKNPRWYRRSGVQVVKSDTFGTRSFFVSTDLLSRFYIYPVDYKSETSGTFLIKDPTYIGMFVRSGKYVFQDLPWSTLGEEPTVLKMTKPLNFDLQSTYTSLTGSSMPVTVWNNSLAWLHSEYPDSTTDNFHDTETSYDTGKNFCPQHYLWTFNYNATRATAIISREDASIPVDFKTLDGTRISQYKIDCLRTLTFNQTIQADIGTDKLPGTTVPEQPFNVDKVKSYFPVLVEVGITIVLTGVNDGDFSVAFDVKNNKAAVDTNEYYLASGYTVPTLDDTKNVVAGNELSYAHIAMYGKSTLQGTEKVQDTIFETPVVTDDDFVDTPQAFRDNTAHVDYAKMLISGEYDLATIKAFLATADGYATAKAIYINSDTYAPSGGSVYLPWAQISELVTSSIGFLVLGEANPINPTTLSPNPGFPVHAKMGDAITSDSRLTKLATVVLRHAAGIYNSVPTSMSTDLMAQLQGLTTSCNIYLQDKIGLPTVHQYNDPSYPRIGYYTTNVLYYYTIAVPYRLMNFCLVNKANWGTSVAGYVLSERVSVSVRDTQTLALATDSNDWLSSLLLCWGCANDVIDGLTGATTVYKDWLRSVIAQALISDGSDINFSPSVDYEYVNNFFAYLPKISYQVIDGYLVPNSKVEWTSAVKGYGSKFKSNEPRRVYHFADMASTSYDLYGVQCETTASFGKKVRNVDALLTISRIDSDNHVVDIASYNILRSDYLCYVSEGAYLANMPQIEGANITGNYGTAPHTLPGSSYGSAHDYYDTSFQNISFSWIHATLSNDDYCNKYCSNSHLNYVFVKTNNNTHIASISAINLMASSVLFTASRANWHYNSFGIGTALYIGEEVPVRNGFLTSLNLATLPARETTKLPIKEFRLFYEHVAINQTLNDVVIGQPLYQDNLLHEDSYTKPNTYLVTGANLFGTSGYDYGAIVSTITAHPNGSLSAYLLPPMGILLWIDDPTTYGTDAGYATYVSGKCADQFLADYKTVDVVHALNPQYNPKDTSPTAKPKWVEVTSHKEIFNAAFGQSRNYSYYFDKATSGFLGGFCTAAVWYTYSLPMQGLSQADNYKPVKSS